MRFPVALISLVMIGPMASFANGPELVQELPNFHRPESVVFSLDGRTLFVSSCGSDVFGPERSFVGFVMGNGAISKLVISETGHATISNLKLIDGLSGNLGIAVLPKATTE